MRTVRIGHLVDSTLIARRIAPIRFVLCAAPAYLERYLVPRPPADLVRHNCLEFSYRQLAAIGISPDRMEPTNV
jgi:DNA-binding transcriptional LysR family regulator